MACPNDLAACAILPCLHILLMRSCAWRNSAVSVLDTNSSLHLASVAENFVTTMVKQTTPYQQTPHRLRALAWNSSTSSSVLMSSNASRSTPLKVNFLNVRFLGASAPAASVSACKTPTKVKHYMSITDCRDALIRPLPTHYHLPSIFLVCKIVLLIGIGGKLVSHALLRRPRAAAPSFQHSKP